MNTTCPNCQIVHDAHDRKPEDRPQPGDVSLCWHCGGVAIFTTDGLRLPTAAEKADIESEPEFTRAREAITRVGTPAEAVAWLWGDEAGS